MTEEIYTEEEAASSEENRNYLTFLSGRLFFAVNTDHVIEIITSYTLTAISLVPDYIRGIINVRGQIIPILDMRLRLGETAPENPDSGCIIILEVRGERVGIIVDSVTQVIHLDPSALSPIPVENRQELANSLFTSPDGAVVLLLNLDALIHQ